jgi:hypothetical protein
VDRDAVKAALDRPDKLPFINRLGGLVYNLPQRHTAMVARRASVAVLSCHPHRGSLGARKAAFPLSSPRPTPSAAAVH